jgi:rSAM/selenodomain-associated transferase 1
MIRRHLILFVREPRYGVGKRRLARDIGDAAALRFERTMLRVMTRRLAGGGSWKLRLAVTPDRAVRRRGLWPRRVAVVAQGGGDLGVRMYRAIAACPCGPVILIGNDIPSAMPHHLAEAFGLLGTHDLVFGPANDGGFWLVGAHRSPRLPPLFGRVRWSSPHALSDVLGDLARRLSVGFAARLDDVDDGASYRRYLFGTVMP